MNRAFLPIAIAVLLGAAGLSCQSKDKDKDKDKSKHKTTKQPVGGKRVKTPPTKSTKPQPKLTVAQWRADLTQLATELPKRHVNLFHSATKQQFDAAVTKLDKNIGAMNRQQIIAELSRLLAMFDEGHTLLLRKKIPYLQLGLYWFADGIYVVRAPRGHGWAVGRKLTHLGGAAIDSVIRKLTQVISRDNASQLKNMMPNYLIDSTILFGLGLSKHKNRAVYTLAGKPDKAGQPSKARQLTVALGQQVQMPPQPKPLPLSRQRNSAHYWSTYVAARKMLYVQYNKCVSASDLPFKKFADDLLAFIDKGDVDRLVIDLRRNGGGDSRVINPLLDGLAKRPRITKRGHLFVLIGRATFSSAVLNTIALKKRFNAILVGEPSGGSPSHYGEVKRFSLSNSKLEVMYSTKYFKNTDMQGASIVPNVNATAKYAAYANGIDAAMAVVHAFN